VTSYTGPLREEPLAIELHNTRYANAGEIVDGLADGGSLRAWLEVIEPRLPLGGSGDAPSADELVSLRDAVREALHALIDGRAPARASLAAINAFSRRAPAVLVAHSHRDERPSLALDFGDASRADVVLGALAADAVELLTGPERDEIRACGAPGCVLIFLRSRTRREWCCAGCGNRARQARHYARTRAGSRPRPRPRRSSR
jgi:predicted RNA-binding Zn ribbon-like protein